MLQAGGQQQQNSITPKNIWSLRWSGWFQRHFTSQWSPTCHVTLFNAQSDSLLPALVLMLWTFLLRPINHQSTIIVLNRKRKYSLHLTELRKYGSKLQQDCQTGISMNSLSSFPYLVECDCICSQQQAQAPFILSICFRLLVPAGWTLQLRCNVRFPTAKYLNFAGFTQTSL